MSRRRPPLPPSRSLPWPLKPLETAKTSLDYDHLGRMVLDIEHDVVRGATPAMIAWWFANIAGEIAIGGAKLDRYLAWHPHDHIHWELIRPAADGAVGVGSRFRIVEAFGRNPDHYVDVIDTVTRLDETGITLVGYALGRPISRLNHDFHPVELGTRYVSRLEVGIDIPVIGPILNPLLHTLVFPEAMGRAWLRHNVEEVGLLEHILPLISPPELSRPAAALLEAQRA